MADKDKLVCDNIDKIITDSSFVEMSIKVMNMEPDIDEDYLVPFTQDETDDDGNPIVLERKGDYGNMISYVPVQYIRERADKAFKRKYSFFIVGERREVNPFERQRYNKEDEEYEYVDGDKYIKCIGMMIVPGLGIRMEYGVKKVRGGAESTDWKACKTDAFKKCCEAFGIYLDIDRSDEDNDSDSGSSGGKRKNNNSKNSNAKTLSDLDLSDIEYDEDELEEALEFEVTFSKKYPNWTLSEIMEDDQSYVIWMYNNGRDDETVAMAGIVLKNAQEEENAKASKRGGRGRKQSSSKEKPSKSAKDDSSDSDENLSAVQKKKWNKLYNICDEALSDYDTVQRKSVIQSVSVSSKYRKGKTNLKQLTLRELEELAEVLADDDE